MSNLIVRKISGNGKGAFALKDFKKGDLITRSVGKIISIDEALKMSSYSLNHMSAVSKGKFILMKTPAKYINHSCNPNVYETEKKIIAARKIKKGEELTFDYSLNGVTGIDDWKMRCRCKSKKCRKMIHGEFFRLPKELQKKYVPYLDSWFRKEFKEELKKLE